MKTATVYEKSMTMYLHSSSKTTAGVWIATAPFRKVELRSTQVAKGEAVLETLNASQDAVPHPTNWNGLLTPLLELAGVKSWATFMKNAKCLSLESEDGRLKVIPQRNLGPKEGFESLPERTIELPLESRSDEIGSALEEAMSRCE